MNSISSCAYIIIYMSLLLLFIFIIFRKKWHKLTADALYKQPLFWLSIIVPILSFVYFGSFSWIGHLPQLDYDGYSNFIKISSLPLAFLALTVPFTAIINNVHRTIQTEEQIRVTTQKNITDSFYSHQKHIIEALLSLPEHKVGGHK
ncbi:TPA: hypothetical protein PXP82_003124, partial [Yersinia enterocolitica]|nr:hypothetical protein [Yersinia enterocolitica]